MVTPMTYEAAQAEGERLHAQHAAWRDKRAQLVRAQADLRASAGQAALAGTSTAKLADQSTRLDAEIRIADEVLAQLVAQQATATVAAQLARIADLRQQVVDTLAQRAPLAAQIQPHLDALEQITGLRYGHVHAPIAQLEDTAWRTLRNADYLEDRLDEATIQQVQAAREMHPSAVDQAIQAFLQPQVQETTG